MLKRKGDLKMFNNKPKRKLNLEGLQTEYTKLKKQHERNVQAGQLKGKIFALKHPTLMKFGSGMQKIGEQQAKGNKRKGKPFDPLGDVDRMFGGW